MDKPWSQENVCSEAFAARKLLLGDAFVLCRDWSMAEDAVQEAFIHIVSRWQDLDNLAGAVPWARAITRLKTREVMRKHKRHQPHAADLLDTIEQALAESDEESAPQQRQQQHFLHECMQQLSALQRDFLHRFYWQQINCEVMAQEGKYRADYIRTIIYRARKKLQACLERKLAHDS